MKEKGFESDWHRKTGSEKMTEEEKEILKLFSGRIGWFNGGHARTFHCHFSAVKIGDHRSTPGGAVDYLAREGDYDTRNADLECIAGDCDKVKQTCHEIDRTARVRNGPNAERVLIKQTFELPAEAPKAIRRTIAVKVVEHWHLKGHDAVAAVHGNGTVQPHIHVAVAARPTSNSAVKDCSIDRSPDKRLMVGKQAVRNARKDIAEIINECCATLNIPRFHPGTLKETGISRLPKRRIPDRAWHALNIHEHDPEALVQALKRHDTARSLHARERERRNADRKLKKAEHLEKQGLVSDRKAKARSQRLVEAERQKGKQMIERLTLRQAELFKDLGIHVPSDFLTNRDSQAKVFRILRSRLKGKSRKVGRGVIANK